MSNTISNISQPACIQLFYSPRRWTNLKHVKHVTQRWSLFTQSTVKTRCVYTVSLYMSHFPSGFNVMKINIYFCRFIKSWRRLKFFIECFAKNTHTLHIIRNAVHKNKEQGNKKRLASRPGVPTGTHTCVFTSCSPEEGAAGNSDSSSSSDSASSSSSDSSSDNSEPDWVPGYVFCSNPVCRVLFIQLLTSLWHWFKCLEWPKNKWQTKNMCSYIIYQSKATGKVEKARFHPFNNLGLFCFGM